MKYGAAWNSPEILARYRWLFLSTGTHLNDHADLRSNKNKVWESRTAALVEALKPEHPTHVVFRTSWFGLENYHTCPCPNPNAMHAPLAIGDRFSGSWKNIAKFNVVFKKTLAQMWPGAVVLDVERILSMRPDCRKDFIHFSGGEGEWGHNEHLVSPLGHGERSRSQLLSSFAGQQFCNFVRN